MIKLLLLFSLFPLSAHASYMSSGAGNATKIQGTSVNATPPTDNQCLVYVNADLQWEPGSCSSGSGIAGSWVSTTGNIVTTNGASTAQASSTALSSVCTLTGSQTLTNKTLTTPIISSISNTGTLTLPTSTDTLVGKATTDTLTNKTLTAPAIGTSATFSYGTASTVPYLDASKNLVSSAVTPTTLGYLDATSSIQTQLNAKAPLASPTFTTSMLYSDGTNVYSIAPAWPGSVTTCTTSATLNFNSLAVATVELDLTASNACTLTVSNVVAGGAYVIKVKNASSATVVWPGSFDWGTAGAPTLSGSGVFDDVHLLVQQSTSFIHTYVSQGYSH